MENPVKKYQLEQDGKNYTLSTQIFEDKLRFVCIQLNPEKPLVFIAQFTLPEITRLSSIFTSISTIFEAHEIFDKLITTQRVSIEFKDNSIYIKITIKQGQREESFSFNLNLFTNNDNAFTQSQQQQQQQSILNSQEKNQFQSQNIELNQNKNQIISQQEASSQYVSFEPNNSTIQNGNINYSDINTLAQQSTTQYIESQNLEQIQNQDINQFLSQNQANENIMLNALNNDYITNYNTANFNSYNNFENVETFKTKTKRKKVEKLTLSLRALPESPENQKYIKNWMRSFSPQKTEESKTEIIQNNIEVYPPSNVEENIVETNTNIQTYEQLYPTQNVEITNEKNIEIENLRNENQRLNEVINQLRTQIQILVQENQNLKLKSNTPSIPIVQNVTDSQELIFLREENNRLIKEMELLRNKLIEFEEYKRLKEEQINYLKIQLEELLQNSKKFEAYALEKDKEIQQLKLYIQDLLKKLQLNESQINTQKNMNIEDQILSIQDTRLEIVKGDIIEDAKELELISRKICKNNTKVSLDLLYKASIDSDKAEVFHNKCDMAKSSLVLVKSKNGKRFGGFTTQDWTGNSIEKKDDNAFVFSLDKMKIYDVIPGEDAIGCYPKYGPVFLGCQIRLYDEFFTKGGTTFEKGLNYSTEEDYELTGGMKKFEVKEVEVYSVELE